MSRLPILVRLTVAFATAMLLVLAACALFVGLRLRADIDDRIDASLTARSAAAARAFARGTNISDVALEDREESFVQVLTASGSVVAQSGTIAQAAITATDVVRARPDQPPTERTLRGVDGRTRILVRPIVVAGATGAIVTGQSLVDRRDALSSVATSFAIGGLISLFVASAIGYALARAGLAPVERIRRKAQQISLSGSPELLPLAPARDQIRRLGETLNEMLGRLRDAFERERRFVADASHEIRTPLAAIRLELEGALQRDDLPDAAREAIAAAHAECLRLARLADDLLVLARLDDGRLPLRIAAVDARAAVDRVRAITIDTAAARDRSIANDVPDDLTVSADPDRLGQVLTNLLDNAVRHGDGRISVSARHVDRGVELTVADEGDGLPRAVAVHAFERFSRGEPGRTGDGAGLGLALVAAIACAHGGRAWVAEQPTRVSVWLPDDTSLRGERRVIPYQDPLISRS